MAIALASAGQARRVRDVSDLADLRFAAGRERHGCPKAESGDDDGQFVFVFKPVEGGEHIGCFGAAVVLPSLSPVPRKLKRSTGSRNPTRARSSPSWRGRQPCCAGCRRRADGDGRRERRREPGAPSLTGPPSRPAGPRKSTVRSEVLSELVTDCQGSGCGVHSTAYSTPDYRPWRLSSDEAWIALPNLQERRHNRTADAYSGSIYDTSSAARSGSVYPRALRDRVHDLQRGRGGRFSGRFSGGRGLDGGEDSGSAADGEQRGPGERWNVYAGIAGETPDLVFSTHMDTVPPYIPFSEDAEYMYGRGVSDAKGIIAAQVAAAEVLRAAGIFGWVAVCEGEERDSAGAKVAN